MIYLLIGLLVLAAVLLFSRWVAMSSPAVVVRGMRWTLIGLVALALVYVVWIGRYQLAAYVLPFLIPALIRWRVRGPEGQRHGPGSGGAWGAGHGNGASASRASMSREEAYAVLGLAPGSDEAAIREAHRRLMAKLHPDRGGSDYLAAKINQARDVLLGL